MDEAQTAQILEHKLRVEPGSLLFIQARVPLKKLPTLCSLYRCFDREAAWVNRSPEVRAWPGCATHAMPHASSAAVSLQQPCMAWHDQGSQCFLVRATSLAPDVGWRLCA